MPIPAGMMNIMSRVNSLQSMPNYGGTFLISELERPVWIQDIIVGRVKYYHRTNGYVDRYDRYMFYDHGGPWQ
jgi:hypothetical protein